MKAPDVDVYILAQPVELQPVLQQLRAIIKSIAPDAAEMISYMVPCYKLQRMFIGFGVHKGGCSLYAMNTNILKEFSAELERKGIHVAGSTIHFSAGKKLPVPLVRKIVKRRMEMELERAAAKAYTAQIKKSKNHIKIKT